MGTCVILREPGKRPGAIRATYYRLRGEKLDEVIENLMRICDED